MASYDANTDAVTSVSQTLSNGQTILRRNRTVINTTTPIDHQYVYWMPDRGNNCAPRRLAGNISANISMDDANGNIIEISRRHKTAEI